MRKATAGFLFGILCLLTAMPSTAQYFRYGKNKVHYEDLEWFYLQTNHFTIYFHDGESYLADFTAHAAEEAFVQLSRLFQHRFRDPIPLIVYQNHGEFVVTNAIDLPTYSDAIGGVTELFKNRIAIPFTGDYREFRRVIHHELVHALINELYYGGSLQAILSSGLQTRLPDWFNEGLAEYAALGWDTQSDMYLREAILEDHLPPIDRLDGFFAYRGGEGVWDYIAEQYGEEKITEILHRLRTTRSVEESIVRSTGLNLDQLSRRWHRALREIYFPEITARESLETIGRALITRENGFYNTSPALSPLGDRVAFVTTTSGLFDVYVADTGEQPNIKRIIKGQTSAAFESLEILTPGLSWSPDGRRLAIAVRGGPSDAIALYNTRTEEIIRIPVPLAKQILSISWSPNGKRIALGATIGSQSDIFVLDLATRELTNLTDDVYSDHEPSWNPDGTALVFHSDRGDHTRLGDHTIDNFDMFEADFSQLDLYLLTPGADRVRRLTHDETWDDTGGRFGSDPDRVLFISDRNGIPNLYEKRLSDGSVRPLTDLDVGVIQAAVSADGHHAAVVTLLEGVPSIFMLRDPFDRRPEALQPTVWAQRVLQDSMRVAPAVALAGSTQLAGNPYLRDATDGTPFARGRERIRYRGYGGDPEALSDLIRKDLGGRTPPDSLPDLRTGFDPEARRRNRRPDSTRGVLVDFGELTDVRSAAGSDMEDLSAFRSLGVGRALTDDEGNYVPKHYKLNFSPDIVYGAAGYDALYGVQGITQMMFSDMLGDHRILVATNLLLDLRNSDYVISYNYLPRRIDWSLSTFHISRLLADFNRPSPTYYRYRQYGASLEASFPIDKFRRVDFDLGVVGVSQADITDVTRPSSSSTLLAPSVTFTRDATTPGFLTPIDGGRFAISLSGAPFGIDDSSLRFGTILMDARSYSSFGRGQYTWAMRASAGTSFGPRQQVFYTSGVQNWINRNFDDLNGFPITDVTDFVFATPIMPLRGFDINQSNGSSFALLNAEFRFPLVAALLPGPIPILPLYNIGGQAFVDIGSVWGGRGDDPNLNFTRMDSQGRQRLDDLMVGTGFGIRTLFLSYPVRFDFAWPFDGISFGSMRTYISVGVDF